MKRLIYLLPLLLIGCKEAPKEYYSAGEVEVIEHTTIVSDSALMFSCIKKVYRDNKIIFDCTK